jgi:GntR family transcriptional repressor for pyruvate dehydrogenase complex
MEDLKLDAPATGRASTAVEMIVSGDIVRKGACAQPPKMAEIVMKTLRRLIVDGQLRDSEFLPTEAQLINEFKVSRQTLREALRILESDGLIEVRRGRSGARVCVPGPEIVARPAALLLQNSHATITDVIVARSCIEATAVRLLAKEGPHLAFYELQTIITREMPAAWASHGLAEAVEKFHRRIVEFTGNATLSIFAGMVHEILEGHSTRVARKRRNISQSQYEELVGSYRHLVDLMRMGNSDEAEKHFSGLMDTTRQLLLNNRRIIRIRDIVD